MFGVGDARLHPAPGHADLVNDLAVLRDIGMIGEGAQDVDRAAFDIIGLKLSAKRELPALGRGQPPCGGVVVERSLERAQQQIAFGAIGEDEAQAAVHFPGGGFQRFADLCDVERDSIENEKVPGLNRAAARLYGLGLAQAGLDFRRYALEQWLERLEVFARLAIRDLLGGALVGAGADMA